MALHNEILRLFMDYSDRSFAFSIHQMIAAGTNPGEWCGPVKASYILRDLCRKYKSSVVGGGGGGAAGIIKNNIEVFVCSGGIIYHDEIINHMSSANNDPNSKDATGKPAAVINSNSDKIKSEVQSVFIDDKTSPNEIVFFDPLINAPPVTPPIEWNNALLLFIPLRLGVSSVKASYHNQIRRALRHSNCVGMLGGKVNHAMYFIGSNTRGQYLGLDPHVVYSTAVIDGSFPTSDLMAQIHVGECELLNETQLDPSVSIAYYFANRAEFEDFCKLSPLDNHSSNSKTSSKHTEFEEFGSKISTAGTKVPESRSMMDEQKLFSIEKFAPQFDYEDDDSNDPIDIHNNTSDDKDDEYVFV